jgi:hypothetical protein
MTTAQTVKVQLVRSPIGTKESHRATRLASSSWNDQQDQLSGQSALKV